MANDESNRGPWVVAGAIVVVGVLIVVALVVLLGGNKSNEAGPSTSPAASESPTETKSPKPPHTKSPRPKPSESPSPTAEPSPSPTVNLDYLLRKTAEKQANRDRPGEVRHVGKGGTYKDKSCPSKKSGVAVIKYDSQPSPGQYIYCLDGDKWVYQEGPIYGE